MIRTIDSPSRQLKLKILSDPANLAGVRQAIETLCAAHDLDKKACEDVGLCVNEALANVIRHAYVGQTDMPIEIVAEIQDNWVRIAIRDWGCGVKPRDLPPEPHNPLKPGGLGLLCLKRMMDEVRFTPQSDGMLLEMVRRRQKN